MINFIHQGNIETCAVVASPFNDLVTAYLQSNKFANTYGQGRNVTEAIASLKIRLNQLKNPDVRFYQKKEVDNV